MEELTLPATARSMLGKKTRFLRRQNITPTHLFGHKLRSLALQCDTAQLQFYSHARLHLNVPSSYHLRTVLVRAVTMIRMIIMV